MVNILFRLKQPDIWKTNKDKPVSFFETEKDFALFQVFRDCFSQKLIKQIGYEAELAHMRYSFQTVEEMAINIKIRGYSDKIFEFIKIYIELMLSCAK